MADVCNSKLSCPMKTERVSNSEIPRFLLSKIMAKYVYKVVNDLKGKSLL